jgi:endonuclease III
MIADEEVKLVNGSHNPPAAFTEAVATLESVKRKKRPRQPRENVSRHFQMSGAEPNGRSQPQSQEKPAAMTPPYAPQKVKGKRKSKAQALELEPQPQPRPPPQPEPRIINGINIDEDLSSDSSLTSVPSDIGPDPFSTSTPSPANTLAIKSKRPKARHPTQSPYFPYPHRHKARPQFISSILPFPPLSTPHFGLMQERLAYDPFRLLIATIFLNKTPGARAMPVFYDLMERYPTPRDLARARVEDVVGVIRCLGFQNQRARKCVAMARVWSGLDDGAGEPRRGRRWAKRDYPKKGDGRGVKVDEWLGDEDERVAWEISHLPGLGAYAHDSWRMFCRDKLRGLADGWNGEAVKPANEGIKQEGDVDTGGQVNGERQSHNDKSASTASEQNPVSTVPFEPEWKRVLPTDKELRAWMTWMWLKEGWVWNKETGERTKASGELMEQARGGGIVREETDTPHLIVEGANTSGLDKEERLDRPAGAFLTPSLARPLGHADEG